MKVDLRRSFTAVQGDFDFQEGIDRALQPDQRNDVAFRERDGVHAGEREALEESCGVLRSRLNRSDASPSTTSNRPFTHPASSPGSWGAGAWLARALRFSSVSPTFPARDSEIDRAEGAAPHIHLRASDRYERPRASDIAKWIVTVSAGRSAGPHATQPCDRFDRRVASNAASAVQPILVHRRPRASAR